MAEADFRLMTEATGQRIAAALEALHLATVTGVKGDAEQNYRHGDVNLTPANIGAVSTSAVMDIPHGGTGATDAPVARANLNVAEKQLCESPNSQWRLEIHDDGIIRVWRYDANIGWNIAGVLRDENGTAPIWYGGTGATTPAGARANLEITPANIGAVIDISTGPTWDEWTNPLPYDVYDTNIDHMKSNFRAIFDTMKLYPQKMCMGVWPKNGWAMFWGHAYGDGTWGDLFFKNVGNGLFYRGQLANNTITVLSVNETVLG